VNSDIMHFELIIVLSLMLRQWHNKEQFVGVRRGLGEINPNEL
jgi:hypothetical protein